MLAASVLSDCSISHSVEQPVEFWAEEGGLIRVFVRAELAQVLAVWRMVTAVSDLAPGLDLPGICALVKR
ncbi:MULTISPECIES: hypothetical protein [unclassified Crossiella]|uniref:hypothetical protein n=1 Tax=unclassified Crossiella TaxID=2620835 RepID=UPI001FFE39A8|nr:MULTISPECIES: hypothetical protein [unclassified Crossiella]MCK2245450.1 hypothetical protein [Crossiella sp. S99.2]MCK2259102.1 hypothetical protein [Crossiella sp. S99.1]